MRSFVWWAPLQVTHEAHLFCISWFCYWRMIYWSTYSTIFQQFQNTYYLSHFLHAPAKTLSSWNHRENSLSLILTMMINDFFSQRQTGSDDKVHEQPSYLSFVENQGHGSKNIWQIINARGEFDWHGGGGEFYERCSCVCRFDVSVIKAKQYCINYKYEHKYTKYIFNFSFSIMNL